MPAQMKQPDVAFAGLDEPLLAPVEKPKGLMLKLVYALSRRQFGTVVTPLKVLAPRLPMSFCRFFGRIGTLDKQLSLPRELVMLIREQVAQINVCRFCIDIGRAFTIRESLNQAKFDALGEYRTNPLFSDAERAVLDYVTELTRNKRADRDAFARMARHFNERQICEVAWVVSTEHVYNMTNIGLNIHSDMLCDITKKKPASL